MIRALDALVQHVSDCVPRLRGALTRRSDCMLAVYPGQGARFQRHVDNTAGDGRLLTALVYLNPGWDRAHGGALRVFDARVGDAPAPAGAFEAVDVFPEAGRVALFFADAVAHEVRPCFAHRHAMTGERAQSGPCPHALMCAVSCLVSLSHWFLLLCTSLAQIHKKPFYLPRSVVLWLSPARRGSGRSSFRRPTAPGRRV